jgi:hypothetical protein
MLSNYFYQEVIIAMNHGDKQFEAFFFVIFSEYFE